MSFFNNLLKSHNLSNHDRRPIWKYFLTDQDFDKLTKELQFSRPYLIDARDVTLYYAEWWKRNYDGGSPSKEAVFGSIGGNVNYNFTAEDFYRLAKKGGRMLGYKWISKQNTLWFKTLLLQGGLPLKHISENQSKYLDFLLAVLEEQPESIEDFMFQPQIISNLPKSSQNDMVYENCFEIVHSILNKENIYDDLLESNQVLKGISSQLKSRAKQLERKVRVSKPKNYWILSKSEGEINIRLTLGLASTYTPETLKNILGIQIKEKEYQFYLNDKLICVFRKLISGKYKTDWFNQKDHLWDGEDSLPSTYVIEDGNRTEVHDFIQVNPTVFEPTLWTKYSDDEWRLIKGSGSTDKTAALLVPNGWTVDRETECINILDSELNWIEFEGEIQIQNSEEHRKYLSDVESFDWTIVSEKPTWMSRINMPVIKRNLIIYVFDASNTMIPQSKFQVWIRAHGSKGFWKELSHMSKLPLGCIDVKIEKDGLIAYDIVYNIDTLSIELAKATIQESILKVKRSHHLKLRFYDSNLFQIEQNGEQYHFKLDVAQFKIPATIKSSIGVQFQKKLFFQMVSPFQGMALVDKSGRLVEESEQLSLKNLYGLRVLKAPGKETVIVIRNKINSEVKISKPLKGDFQPLMAYRDEIVRLFYLADAMDYQNKVCLELKSGQDKKVFEISGFTNTLNVNHEDTNQVSLFQSNDDLELFAIPINSKHIDLTPMPLEKDNEVYRISESNDHKQWIIISTKEDGNQLMPRFVNLDPELVYIEKEERIQKFCEELNQKGYKDIIWNQLLSLFNIASKSGYDVPFSTFDQFRSLALDSKLAARAFMFLGINQADIDTFIQKDIPEMEKDLGFCFHWIKKEDWETALEEVIDCYGALNFTHYVGVISSYMQESGLGEIFQLIMGNDVKAEFISHSKINELRSHLGARVLHELPQNSPRLYGDYNIPIKDHIQVKLLLKSPIAVAESIKNVPTDYPIWGMTDIQNIIRRNIQYSQYLNPKFYNNIILHVLNCN